MRAMSPRPSPSKSPDTNCVPGVVCQLEKHPWDVEQLALSSSVECNGLNTPESPVERPPRISPGSETLVSENKMSLAIPVSPLSTSSMRAPDSEAVQRLAVLDHIDCTGHGPIMPAIP